MRRILLLCLVTICIVTDNMESSVPVQKQHKDSIVIEMTVNDTIYLGTINKK